MAAPLLLVDQRFQSDRAAVIAVDLSDPSAGYARISLLEMLQAGNNP